MAIKPEQISRSLSLKLWAPWGLHLSFEALMFCRFKIQYFLFKNTICKAVFCAEEFTLLDPDNPNRTVQILVLQLLLVACDLSEALCSCAHTPQRRSAVGITIPEPSKQQPALCSTAGTSQLGLLNVQMIRQSFWTTRNYVIDKLEMTSRKGFSIVVSESLGFHP